ncbi:MAG TPA: Asp-tRNA(Asn)/Glu-tRNA(Gln) amidotransferase subunit GatA [Vicinamibacterales bacterium]|nr:Asp-tRNA(Asn)/Glu-tRNA(Gln) amidotransferase subunit GatA [Vicinamibacterales bacterium]
MEQPFSVTDVREAIASGRASAVEICRAALDRIAATDGALNAFRAVAPERALARAAELDGRADRATLPLLGVPVALKDNLCTRGIATTAGSRMLEGYLPPYDATVVERLEAAGAVIVGKTNCDEFAMGSSTENSAYGPTRNPWAVDRTPGGSSGGSAAAVAARMVPLSLGSDTGGSIRQPAALCGVVGFKPSYGRVSRYGLIAFASSLDQVGPFATTVRDAAIALEVLAGHDPRDSTSSSAAVPAFTRALDDSGGDLKGIRIGVPRALFTEGVDAEVLAAFDAALDVTRARGADVIDVALPYNAQAIPVYYIVATAEASANLARYDGVRYGYRAPGARSVSEMYERSREEGFGREVKRRIILGTYVLSAGYYDAYYLKAQQVRTLIKRDYDTAFASVDVIAVPTSPTPAFPLGERTGDPVRMYLSDVFTVSANLAGLPAITVPCGFAGGRLPVGLQFTGRPMDDAVVLRVADGYERATSWSSERPAAPASSPSR